MDTPDTAEPLPVAEELPPAPPGRFCEASPNTASHTTTPNRRPVRHLNPVRLLLTLRGGFVCLFLFLRVVAVEPFGAPTGSMAPALIGNHREGPCPRCGYPVRVGFPSPGVSPESHFANVACPNCGERFSLAEARDLNGDR